jgi:hypothetical protein
MRTLWLIPIVAIFSFGGTARADDVAAAEAMFQKGKAHMDAGRFAEACADFAVSESLDSSVGTLLNLGECNEKLGKTASSWAAFKKASVKAERDGQLRRQEYADQRAAQILPRLTQLKVVMSGARPAGLKVTRNGEDMTLLIGSSVPVDPAEYVFEATASAHKSWTKKVAVTGEGQSVDVEIPALEAAPVSTTTDTSDTSDTTTDTTTGSNTLLTTQQDPMSDSDPGKRRRTIALAVGGVGAATVATGLVFGFLARSDWKDSEAHCDSDDLCDQTGVDFVDDAKRNANISTALVSIGGAALIAGGVLWFTAPEKSTSGLAAIPVAGPDRVGFALTGGF